MTDSLLKGLTLSDARSLSHRVLEIELPYFERSEVLAAFQEKVTREAAVLICLGAKQESDLAHILVLKRTESVSQHKGQMAFPGGALDPADCGDRVKAALREAVEEVALPTELLSVEGILPGMPTISRFWITPVLAFLNVPIETVPLTPDPSEVAETLWVPWSRLSEPGVYSEQGVKIGMENSPSGIEYAHTLPVYQISREHRIWGATGVLIHHLKLRFAMAAREISSKQNESAHRGASLGNRKGSPQ